MAIPCCGSLILFILFCSIRSIRISPPYRCSPFGDASRRRQSPPGTASSGRRPGPPSERPLCRSHRTALSGSSLGAAFLVTPTPARRARLRYRLLARAAAQLFGTRGSGHPEGRVTPHRTATATQFLFHLNPPNLGREGLSEINSGNSAHLPHSCFNSCLLEPPSGRTASPGAAGGIRICLVNNASHPSLSCRCLRSHLSVHPRRRWPEALFHGGNVGPARGCLCLAGSGRRHQRSPRRRLQERLAGPLRVHAAPSPSCKRPWSRETPSDTSRTKPPTLFAWISSMILSCT